MNIQNRIPQAKGGQMRDKARIFMGVVLFSLLLISQTGASAGELKIPKQLLNNGLQVFVIENHTAPLVTIEIAVKNGAYTESPEYDGLSHLYEHMFFKGNAVIPNQEKYLERQRELGMVWNGTTSDERVNYFFTLPKGNLKEGLIFMRDAITTPIFDQTELEREREVVLSEYDRAESNPYYYLSQAVNKKLWYKYPSYKDVLGTRDTIATATREKLQTIQKRFYIPNNSALFVAGDVKPGTVFKLAKKFYGGWKMSEDPFDEYPLVEHPSLTKKEVVIVNQPVNIAAVQIMYHGPDVRNDVKATYAADVFSYILGQPNSKFQKNIVDSKVALRANLGYYTLQNVGPITVFMQTTPDSLRKAIDVLFDEIDKFDDPTYYTYDQLESAKTLLEVEQTYDRERTSQFVHTASFWWAIAGLDYYIGYIDSLRKVTREDINDYVHEYIQGQNYVMGILISEDEQQRINLTAEEVLNE
jgi:zinc protease